MCTQISKYTHHLESYDDYADTGPMLKSYFCMTWLLVSILLGTMTAPAWTQSSHKPVVQRHSSKRRRSARKAAPSYQLHPDSQRYQEIQKALADRSYFKGEVNGQWRDDSVDALKRFQADQKLPNDGKINSLSLIGLGLGPKHNGSTVTTENGTVAPAAEAAPAPVPETIAPSTPEKSPR